MAAPRCPSGLGPRGRRLWREAAAHPLAGWQRETLTQACRTADRLDALAAEIDAAGALDDEGRVSPALIEERQQGQALKMLLVALRLPDEATGTKPQRRGQRGSQAPKGAGTVTTLDRLLRSG